MKNELHIMDNGFIKFLEDMGIDYKYVLNGFIGALIWSVYKKLKFIEAVRQILIGSVVAGYITPLIAHEEKIPVEYMAALSFIVGMMGMVIIDSIYKYIVLKVRAFKKGKSIVQKEEDEKNEEDEL